MLNKFYHSCYATLGTYGQKPLGQLEDDLNDDDITPSEVAIICFQIGCMYLYGYDVQKDFDKAKSYLFRSMRIGHAGATYELVREYLSKELFTNEEIKELIRYIDIITSSEHFSKAHRFDIRDYSQANYVEYLKQLYPHVINRFKTK